MSPIPPWFSVKNAELKNYSSFKKLAEGGFGEIYKATYHTNQGRTPVIIKRLRPIYVYHSSRRQSFEREVKILKKINHPQIPQFIGDYLSEEECFFIMSYVNGMSLKTLIDHIKKSNISFPFALAFEFILQTCRVLHYLHHYQEGGPIIHCDIKPDNLLITKNLEIMLIDFSVAFQTEDPALAHKGGTYRFMSRERLTGEQPNPQTDLFSLLVTLFEMITLRPLLTGQTIFQIFSELLSENHLKIIRQEQFPKSLERTFHSGLTSYPENRFKNTNDLVESVQQCVKEMGLSLEQKDLKADFAKITVSLSKKI